MNKLVHLAAFLILLTFGVFAQQAPRQKSYSESAVYTPRVIPQKDTNKKQEMASSTAVPADEKSKSIRVSVLDRNWKPVTGLTKGDFKLFVDDQETEIASLETSSAPINFVFMIDNSVSTTMAFKDLAQRVERVLDALDPGDRVMAIAFSEKFKVIYELTDDREKLRKAVRKAVRETASGTSIYDHIQNVSASMDPIIPDAAAVILFTDGVDTTSRTAIYDTSLTAAERANAAYYVVYLDTLPFALASSSRLNQNLRALPVPLGIKPSDPKQLQLDYDIGLKYLNDLMALSGGFTANDAIVTGPNKMLSTELPAAIRSQYVITFTPRPGSTVGQRRHLNVRVNRPNLAVFARGSFIAQ